MKTASKVSRNFKQSGEIKSLSADIGRNLILGQQVIGDVSFDLTFSMILISFWDFLKFFEKTFLVFLLQWKRRLKTKTNWKFISKRKNALILKFLTENLFLIS